MLGKILTGTASWTDPAFVADWYPKTVPASKRLAWYAEHFNLVEVNSTFYRLPEARIVRRWCQETPDGFVFDVKLHRLLSRHSTKPELLPADLRPRLKVTKIRPGDPLLAMPGGPSITSSKARRSSARISLSRTLSNAGHLPIARQRPTKRKRAPRSICFIK